MGQKCQISAACDKIETKSRTHTTKYTGAKYQQSATKWALITTKCDASDLQQQQQQQQQSGVSYRAATKVAAKNMLKIFH